MGAPDPTKVPFLSSNDIEVKAEEVIGHLGKSILNSGQATPIREFVLEASQQFKIHFLDDTVLGQSSSGRKYLGHFRPKPREIFIDVSLKNSERYPFVLAHEFGHFVLHRRVDPEKSGYSTSSLRDTEYDLVTGQKILSTPRDWIEWQANRFASAFLMPRVTFQHTLVRFQKEQGITRNLGLIYVDATTPSRRDFNVVLAYLATVYGVNHTNTECRLRELELLHDHRYTSTQHISKFLKEE